MQIHVPSTSFDVISFNVQGQLCTLTWLCRVERSLKPYQNELNSVKGTGQKGKNHVTLTWKFPWKSSCSTRLPLTFPTKMKPTKYTAKGKKWGKKSEKRGEERKRKVKVKTAVSLLDPKTRTFAFWPNFASQYFASGSEGREVYDL